MEISRSLPEAFSGTRQQGIRKQAEEDYLAHKAQIPRILHNKAVWQAEGCSAARQPRRNRQVEGYSEARQNLQRLAVHCLETQAHSRQELLVVVCSVPTIPSSRIRLAVYSEQTRELQLRHKLNHFLVPLQVLPLERVFCKRRVYRFSFDLLWLTF